MSGEEPQQPEQTGKEEREVKTVQVMTRRVEETMEQTLNLFRIQNATILQKTKRLFVHLGNLKDELVELKGQVEALLGDFEDPGEAEAGEPAGEALVEADNPCEEQTEEEAL